MGTRSRPGVIATAFVVVVVALACTITPAHATTVKVWAGGPSGTWSDAAAWSPSGVPGVFDDVVISDATVAVDESVALTATITGDAADLVIATAAKLTVLDAVAGPRGLRFSGPGELSIADSLTSTTAVSALDPHWVELDLGGSVFIGVVDGLFLRCRAAASFAGTGAIAELEVSPGCAAPNGFRIARITGASFTVGTSAVAADAIEVDRITVDGGAATVNDGGHIVVKDVDVTWRSSSPAPISVDRASAAYGIGTINLRDSDIADLTAGTEVRLLDVRAPGPSADLAVAIGPTAVPEPDVIATLPNGNRVRTSGKLGDGNDFGLVVLGAEPVVEPPVEPPPLPQDPAVGYYMIGALGSVYGFGDATVWSAPIAGGPFVAPYTDIEIDPAADAYFRLRTNGTVDYSDATGTETIPGADGQLRPGETAVSISVTPDGDGYWIFTSQGRVFPFFTAGSYGDLGAVTLNAPIIGSVATPDGLGYWMVAKDGGIFTFGSARFFGSTGDVRLNQPVVGMVPDPDGTGYWLVAADGGMFSFQAGFRGSIPGVLAPGQRLSKPIIGAVSYGDGYLMVASDGGIFSFSDQPFLGSLGASPPAIPITNVAAFG